MNELITGLGGSLGSFIVSLAVVFAVYLILRVTGCVGCKRKGVGNAR